jgi:hypothetical protein
LKRRELRQLQQSLGKTASAEGLILASVYTVESTVYVSANKAVWRVDGAPLDRGVGTKGHDDAN